jgi:hypothetical protein
VNVWPEFDVGGDLPPGVHPASLAQVVEHFGTATPRRQSHARRLELIHTLARASGGLARFVIFGSFVTATTKNCE